MKNKERWNIWHYQSLTVVTFLNWLISVYTLGILSLRMSCFVFYKTNKETNIVTSISLIVQFQLTRLWKSIKVAQYEYLPSYRCCTFTPLRLWLAWSFFIVSLWSADVHGNKVVLQAVNITLNYYEETLSMWSHYYKL